MSNDFVAMEKNICPVCGVTHTYSIGVLINKYLKPIKSGHEITGYGLCEEHDKLYKDGYIALIVASNDEGYKDTLNMEEADKTGDIAHMKREVFNNIFNTNTEKDAPFVFITQEAFNMIRKKK